MEYPNKDAFVAVLKRYSFNNSVNYYVTKFRFEKFEGICAIRDGRSKWKIMGSFHKKIGLWTIKMYSGPHTYIVAGASQDCLRLDSGMISDIILLMVKMIPRILVLVMIANIRSQYKDAPSYYKV
ncbi:hypothetical protein J1N35_007905 [Gossypium stocksii]|uniref:Uncharacterized protein n=1 Tax=Gossypium stocksii TaxID=47602 RepID=A0A9D3W8E4_9ROSI|nr:hypothetical protein J1N35_007905 [Gossypium stocksii]